MLQYILSEEKWQARLSDADRRAPSPLFWTHVNPYGRFELDMASQLDIALPNVPDPRAAANVDTGRPLYDGTEVSATGTAAGCDH